jgi:glucose-6-phosphate isomerase
MNPILLPGVSFSGQKLAGEEIHRINRTLEDLTGVFYDEKSFATLSPETLVYEVESYFPVPENTEGGLFAGITYIHPGTVGGEYFMTKGHFHKIRNRGEFYYGIKGEGMLLLMDEHHNTWAEKMYPGSLHYIGAHIAHRTANTGNSIFSFGAVWPADAGHDYDTIKLNGFSKILVNHNGTPALVDRR